MHALEDRTEEEEDKDDDDNNRDVGPNWTVTVR